MTDQPIETTAVPAQPQPQPAPGQLVTMPDGSQAIMTTGPDGAAVFTPVAAQPAPAPEPPAEVVPEPTPAPAPEPVAEAAPESAAAPEPVPAPAAVPATVPATATPAVPAPAPSLTTGLEGLDGVDASDLMMPMVRIVHDEAVYEDSLSGEKFEDLDVILLGLVKQRVLWPSEIGEESEAPLCRSYNFTLGIPGEKFAVHAKRDPASPLDASGFTQPDMERGELPCAECNLKDWGSHPSRDIPWCVEQYVFAVMLGEPDEPIGSPAILTLQRSAMKPAKAYITSFVRSKKPLFVARTTLKLDGRSRGTVKYAIPKFVKGVATDPDYHGEYAELFRQVRDFVTTPRVREDDEGTSVTVSSSPPAPAHTAASTSEEDLPF